MQKTNNVLAKEAQIGGKQQAVAILSSISPDCAWLLGQIESDQGYLKFPPKLNQIIVNLKIENYPILYENENAIGLLMLRSLLPEDDFREFQSCLAAGTREEMLDLVCEFSHELEKGFDAVVIPKTRAEEEEYRRHFETLSEGERAEAIKSAQYFFMSFLCGFHQNLCIMVHGEKLTSLVNQAKRGDDSAFVKAVQIDKRILTVIPYFKARYEEAQTCGDSKFLDTLGAHISRPPYRGRIRHKSLYMAFAMLDTAGILGNFTHAELLDILTEGGINAHESRIDDVKNLTKRLADFRRFQRNGMDVSTP